MRPHVQFCRFLALLMVALMVTACARRPAYVAEPVAIEAVPAPDGAVVAPVAAYGPAAGVTGFDAPYQLDAGDRLRIQVFGQEGLSNSYIVDASGFVSISLIGAVPARGLTTAELARAIAARLRNGFIRQPHVSVEVEAYRPFFILGEVNAPGQYPYVPNMTVEAAVAIAGGFAPRASKTDIVLARSFNGATYRGPVPPDYPLRPGDTITIKERWF